MRFGKSSSLFAGSLFYGFFPFLLYLSLLQAKAA